MVTLKLCEKVVVGPIGQCDRKLIFSHLKWAKMPQILMKYGHTAFVCLSICVFTQNNKMCIY